MNLIFARAYVCGIQWCCPAVGIRDFRFETGKANEEYFPLGRNIVRNTAQCSFRPTISFFTAFVIRLTALMSAVNNT